MAAPSEGRGANPQNAGAGPAKAAKHPGAAYTQLMTANTPEGFFFAELLEQLRASRWNVEEQVPVVDSDLRADAEIWHAEVADGRKFYLAFADPAGGPDDDRSQIWLDVYESTGQNTLIAHPHPDLPDEGSSPVFDWLLVGHKQEFTLSVPELASYLEPLLVEPGHASAARSDRNVWLCQYRPDDHVSQWTKDARPGSIIRWKTEKKSLPREMQLVG